MKEVKVECEVASRKVDRSEQGELFELRLGRQGRVLKSR